MTLGGATSKVGGAVCSCGRRLALQVCESAAGHYLGYWCDECGPWSRESGYMTQEIAAQLLETIREVVTPKAVLSSPVEYELRR